MEGTLSNPGFSYIGDPTVGVRGHIWPRMRGHVSPHVGPRLGGHISPALLLFRSSCIESATYDIKH
eukprot:11769674-Karenia_brevis.AAC.1